MKLSCLFIGTVSGQETGEYACNRRVLALLGEVGADVTMIDTNLMGASGRKNSILFKVLRMIRIYMLSFFKTRGAYDCVYIVPGLSKAGLYRFAPLFFLGGVVGKKVIVHYHGSRLFQTFERFNKLETFFWSRLYLAVDTNVFLSEALLAKGLKYPFINGARVVPNFVDVGLLDYLDSKPKSNSQFLSEQKFLFLSNLIPEKGVLAAVEIVVYLRGKGFNVSLTIVGNGSEAEKQSLKSYISDKNAFIEYKGPLYGEKKYKVLNESRYLLFPSSYQQEAFPLVILEAMASGLLVFATEIGAIPEIIENNTSGFLMGRGSVRPSAWGDFIGATIASEDKVRNVQVEARRIAAKYTEANFKSNILELIYERK